MAEKRRYRALVKYREYSIIFDTQKCLYLVPKKNSRARPFLTLEDAYEYIDFICDWR